MSAALELGTSCVSERALNRVRHFVKAGPTRIDGPFKVSPGSSLETELRVFREQTYAQKRPVLASPAVRGLDEALSLDSRAVHFIARHDGLIQGAVRALRRPFEFELLEPALGHSARVSSGHLEVSRLLTGVNATDSRLAIRLLLAVGLWGRDQNRCTGFFALCTGLSLRVFRQLGLTSVRDGICLQARPGRRYSLVCGEPEQLARNADDWLTNHEEMSS